MSSTTSCARLAPPVWVQGLGTLFRTNANVVGFFLLKTPVSHSSLVFKQNPEVSQIRVSQQLLWNAALQFGSASLAAQDCSKSPKPLPCLMWERMTGFLTAGQEPSVLVLYYGFILRLRVTAVHVPSIAPALSIALWQIP